MRFRSRKCMDSIEVIVGSYRFRFRRLYWKEELGLRNEGRDPRRVVLAQALEEVSGLKIEGFDEAWRVLCPEVLPTPILHRVFLVYKGKQPQSREFETRNLYKAPEPFRYEKQVEAETEATERKADAVVEHMERQFGKRELEEAAEVDRQIVRGSKLRGAVRKFADEDTAPLGGFEVKPNA